MIYRAKTQNGAALLEHKVGELTVLPGLAQEAEGILNSAAAIIFWGKCDAFSSLRQLLS
jgi:hypothetical protein